MIPILNHLIIESHPGLKIKTLSDFARACTIGAAFVNAFWAIRGVDYTSIVAKRMTIEDALWAAEREQFGCYLTKKLRVVGGA